MAVGKAGKNRKARCRSQSRTSRHNWKRMGEKKPKSDGDTLRGGFRPDWEKED